MLAVLLKYGENEAKKGEKPYFRHSETLAI